MTGGPLFRVDLVRRANWPPFATCLAFGAVYLLALALMTIAWLSFIARCSGRTRGPAIPAGRILLFGLLVHGLALAVPPMMSDDVLAYAAIGRSMQHYGQPASQPLGQSLPTDDPFRQAIEQYPNWLKAGSAYATGFNVIARGVAAVAGDDLRMALLLFQAVGLVAVVLTALATSRAARDWTLATVSADLPPTEADEAGRRAGTAALALVLFSPMTILEATSNAHNDSLLALCVALFAWAVAARHGGLGIAALAGTWLVKASGMLLLGFELTRLVVSPLRAWLLARRRLLATGAVACGVLGVAVAVGPARPILNRQSSTIASLLGSPDDKMPYCTRSLESAPRAILHIVLKQPRAAWLVGLVFRAAAVALLVYLAVRAEPGIERLTWAGTFVFLYYMYLHAHSQPWYLLALLPLVPMADERLRPAMLAAMVSNLASYSVAFSWNGTTDVLVAGVFEVVSGLVVLIPPSVVLVRSLRAGSPQPRSAAT
jgi:hypothetical protein